MNIFALHNNPFIAALMMCDKHIVKMIIETCQILSMVLDSNMDIQYRSQDCPPSKQLGCPQYPKNHLKHPSTLWTMQSRGNYKWLVQHLRGLCSQYRDRYGKVHKLEGLIMIYEAQEKYLKFDNSKKTKFCIAITDKTLHHHDPVIAYRNYYNMEKSRFAKWKTGAVPAWFKPGEMITA